ncbi:MAG TPA: AAA family ATPase [Candidatus Udaeobacter sp.]|jgi:pilus assembly protein CpaE|nr:AAA family ATPase [Candidatus Udaeobacter sp.]
MSTLTVVLVLRNEFERSGVRTAFESVPNVSIAGERPDLRAGMALARQVRPSLLLLELVSPVDDVIAEAERYKLENPDGAVILYGDALDQDTLLRALRAGASDVLRRPLDRGALSESIDRVGKIMARKQGTAATRFVLTVFSNKGGTGTSTIATNLAVSLKRQTQQRVVLADFDYQSGDVAGLLKIDPHRSLADLLIAQRIDSASVQDVLMKHPSGISVLAEPDALDRVEAITAPHVGNVLDVLSSMYEIVVVDAPHAFNEITLEIFDRSSVILLAVEMSVPSVRAARRSIEIFHKLNYLALPDRVRVVVNRRDDHSALTIGQVEEALGMRVFASIANDYAAVSEAINLGKPLCGEPSDSRAAMDLAALARQLSPVTIESKNGTTAEVAVPRRSGRLRIFGRG